MAKHLQMGNLAEHRQAGFPTYAREVQFQRDDWTDGHGAISDKKHTASSDATIRNIAADSQKSKTTKDKPNTQSKSWQRRKLNRSVKESDS
jgi:hypothetical protein